MEYTVKKLAELAGVTPRTLRFYDESGLLRPKRVSSSGYRIYGAAEVDRLQQILFYREMGLELDKIREALDSPQFDRAKALREHLATLTKQRERLDALIGTVEKTILSQEGKMKMTDKEKFEGLKKGYVDENEKKYGKEIRSKYGDDTIDASNKKVMDMNETQYERMERVNSEIVVLLEKALASGAAVDSEQAKEIFALHKEMLEFTWPKYTPEAHIGVAEMYVCDQRFTDYYDKNVSGCAALLRDIIKANA